MSKTNKPLLAPGRVLGTKVATSTGGAVGASFAVVHKDWRCSLCQGDNSGRYKTCVRCREGKRPDEAHVWHNGSAAMAAQEDHGWREALDPETKQIYYVNASEGGRTSWERPQAMGPAPLNTGWFGRGGTQQGFQLEMDRRNAEYLARPAVQQAEPPASDTSGASTAAAAAAEGSGEFNIWFGRYQGQNWTKGLARGEKADSRCLPAQQAGKSLASSSQDGPFCLWFARGVCHRGAQCRFHHRVPVMQDCGRMEKDSSKDVFGRPRGTQYREDMSGVSSLHDPSRTLYVSGLVRGPYETNHNLLEQCVLRHFTEWGEVESVNIVWRLSVAFVRYRFRTSAEFALEAMDHQSLDNEEVLKVRWAHEDPNPVAKQAAERANADAVVAAVQSLAPDALQEQQRRLTGGGNNNTTTTKRLKQ